MDEQWSFVGNKKNQRWLWYAWCADTHRVLAYEFGRRKDAVLEKLLTHLSGFKIKTFFTDDWGAYERLLPESKHIIGKANTQGYQPFALRPAEPDTGRGNGPGCCSSSL